MFDADAMRAQGLLSQIQGRDRLWFCGSYAGYGFHEDALASAVEVARQLGAEAPWAQELAAEQQARADLPRSAAAS